MVFGSLLSTGELKASSYTLRAERRGSSILYTRERNGKKEVEVMIRGKDVYLVPHPPSLLPERGLFRHVMIRLDKPLIVSPASEITLETLVPIDLAVTVDNVDLSNVIDIFSLRTPKMAVYGEVQEGVLTRHLEVCKEGSQGCASVTISIKNSWERVASISKIVFSSEAFSLCFKLASWQVRGPVIKVSIEGPERALVEVEPPLCGGEYIQLSRGGQRLFAEGSSKYYMKYGYSGNSKSIWGD